MLTPTRELAQQVYKSIAQYAENCEITAAVAYGGVSIKPQIEALNAGADILIATPGRLLDHLINGSLTLENLEYLKINDCGLETLITDFNKMESLKKIDLSNNNISFLPYIDKLTKLERLNLSNNNINGISDIFPDNSKLEQFVAIGNF